MDGPEDQPEKPAIKKAAKARGARVTIYTNLPQTLPVLPKEVALIHSFLGELVARLAVNDNGDEA